MGKLVISTNATLDGFVQDPDGQEGKARGGWFRQFGGSDLEAWTKLFTDEALRTEALLFGRRSEAWFGSRWATRDGAWADRLNSLPKYVVSQTLAAPTWKNAQLVKGDVAAEVARLKKRIGGDIVVYGSYQLAHALLDHDLVDELRLVTFPVVLGTGERLFGSTGAPKGWRLAATRTLGQSLQFSTYERAASS